MKDFPIIPLIMCTTLTMIILHGLRVSRENNSKVEYSMAAGVDAHLTLARDAFLEEEEYEFKREMKKATELLSKEANCDKCIDKGVARESLAPLLSIKNKYESGLGIDEMDRVFGEVIKALAKNHLTYTLENLNTIEDDFYLQDAIRHLKFSMKYLPKEVREKEKIAAATLEEALSNHEIDEELTKKILNEVVSSI